MDGFELLTNGGVVALAHVPPHPNNAIVRFSSDGTVITAFDLAAGTAPLLSASNLRCFTLDLLADHDRILVLTRSPRVKTSRPPVNPAAVRTTKPTTVRVSGTGPMSPSS
jgi:hypothetical protein